jgi:hypothetical protein
MTIGNGSRPGDPGKGYDPVNKFGLNLDIDTGTTPETIWSNGGVFPFLDAGISMSIKSSAAADTLAGTGAQKVRITYYQTDNTEITVEKDMDGVSLVLIDADTKIVTRIEVIQTGTSMTNEGKITVVDTATGLVVYQSVEIGEGQTLSAVQICPKGKKGLIVKHYVTYAKFQSPAGTADMRLKLRQANGSILTKHAVELSTIKEVDEYEYPIGGIKMVEGEIIYWNCESVSAANTPIEGRFDIEFTDV